jgi:uncharacterized membrane protein
MADTRRRSSTNKPSPVSDALADDQISQNIAAVHDFYTREESKLSASQRHAEATSDFIGQPAFLWAILIFTALWMSINLGLLTMQSMPFDHPPFHWLQGILALAALLVTIVVLIKQNRIAKLSEQRDHLDLKMTMLIEQKTAKLIDLIEELRRDLPNVKNRHDSGAAVMQSAMSPERVLAALDEELVSTDGSVSASTSKEVIS